MVTRVWSAPVNFKDASGAWRAIDTTLEGDGAGGAQTAAGPVALRLPASLADGATVSADGDWVRFGLDGANGQAHPQLSGSSATYPDVLPGVDASYRALTSGVKETLTLADASAPANYRFSLASSAGLSARLRDGAVEVRDSSDRLHFVVPAPTVSEAGGTPSREHVRYTLSPSGDAVTVAVDPEWLAKARFPVRIDPSTFSGDAVGCTLADGSSSATADCDGATLSVGHDSSHTYRAAVRFTSLGGVPRDAAIFRATMAFGLHAQSNATATDRLDVYGAGHRIALGATWESYDGTNAWDTPGGDLGTREPNDFSFTSAAVGGWVSLDVAALAQQWLRDPSQNRGVIVKSHDETADNVLTLDGVGYTPVPGVNEGSPTLEIDWEHHPGFERDGTYEQLALDDRSSLAVNVASGNLALDSHDIDLSGVAGMDLRVGRTYNAQSLGRKHTFGSAWSETVNGASTRMDVTWQSGTRAVYANGGAIYRFDRDPSRDNGSTHAYSTPPGIDADMTYDTATHKTTLKFRRTGETWTFGRDDGSVANLDKITDKHGNTILVDYYSTGPAAVSIHTLTDSHGHVLTFSYDADGALERVTDVSGRHWDYGVSTHTSPSYKRLDSYTDPDGHTTSYGYDTADPGVYDKLVQITDARGHLIKLSYGPNGDWSQVTKITRVVDGGAGDVVWRFDYTPDAGTGHACSGDTSIIGRTVETDPRGHQITYCHNARGEVVETYDQLGHETATSYTAAANVQDLTAFAGTGAAGTTSYTYDLSGGGQATNNLTRIDQPAGEQTNASYWDAASNPNDALRKYRVKQSTDPQGASTFYGYDDVGDLTEIKDDDSSPHNQQSLDYNDNGTLESATDGKGHETTYDYTDGNLTAVHPPSSSNASGIAQLGDTSYTYDSVGRVRTVTDGRGTTRTLSYDGEDRVTCIEVSDGSWWTFSYDGDGNLIERHNSAGQTSGYGYDELNRRTSETFPGGVSNAYGYDKAGNITSITDANGTVSYGYDAINRLASITSPTATGASTDTVNYAYDDSTTTHKQTLTFPGGSSEEISRDASGKVTKVLVKDSAGNALARREYAYAYSAAGGGSAQSQLVQTLTRLNGDTTSYGYGSVDQLTSATTTNGSSSVGSYSYAYDDALNRTSKTHTDSSGTTTTTYVYNANNQLCWSTTASTSHTDCNAPPSGARLYGYDANGNQTTGGSGSAKTYDALDRLTGLGGETMSYLSPDNTELVADGSRTLSNDLLGLSAETDGSTTTAIARDPISGAASSLRDGTSKRYFITDNIGSTTALLDAGSGGTVSRSYTYDPDGNTATTGSGPETDLQFAGGQGVGGVYHFGARYYDPRTTRWTQPDAVQQYAELREANRYVYAGGDPVNFVDSSGRSVFSHLFCAGYSIAAGAVGTFAGTAVGGPAGGYIVGTAAATAGGSACEAVLG